MRPQFIVYLLLFLILSCQEASASAVVEQRQRAIQQAQQEAIRQQQLQVIQQQQQAYQQAIIQRQQAQGQVYQQAIQQRTAQQRAYNEALQHKVQEIYQQNQKGLQSAQQQAIAQMQAQQQAYQQAMQRSGVLMSNQMQPPSAASMNIPGVQGPAYGNLFYTPPVEEVVNITQVWEKMETNSQSWFLMIDMEPKVLTVQRMIDHFRNQGVRVHKPASHYVQLIDSMAFQNPELLNQPFENIMKVVAIIEYDFDNGQDKDALAHQVFPDDQQFQANKKRLGF